MRKSSRSPRHGATSGATRARLTPFAEAGEATTVRQLDDALRNGVSPGSGVLDRLRQTVERDIADLRPHLEARAAESENAGESRACGKRASRSRGDGRRCCERQIDKVREAMRSQAAARAAGADRPLRPIAGRDPQAGGARDAPVRSGPAIVGRKAAASAERDLDSEPEKVRRGYEVQARRLEPIGLVYLWPATN